jgi:hypothetical protein
MRQPNSRRNLDMAIRRASEDDRGYLMTRTCIANVVVGQMLPDGVVKGGSSLKMRYGRTGTRFTADLDAARSCDLVSFLDELGRSLAQGWNGFTGRLVTGRPAHPKDVPDAYVMQPFEVKLSYNGQPWVTVPLEIGHDEIGDADEADLAIAPDIVDLFEEIGLPEPGPVALMPLRYQVAQKLHALTSPGSSRAHDLIDLQVICQNGSLDLVATRKVCTRLFDYRDQQAWPPAIVSSEGWSTIYREQSEGLDVLPELAEAIDWGNDLITEINGAGR